MTDSGPKLAVLGLGTMGRAMAGSALRHGIPTVVWNRDPDATRGLAEQGARVAASASEAVEAATMAITMVTDAQAVTSIAVDLGMLEALPAGAVWAQMSTIGIEGTAAISTIVERQRPEVFFPTHRSRGARCLPSKEGSPSSPPGPKRRGLWPSLSFPRSGNGLFGSGRLERARA